MFIFKIFKIKNHIETFNQAADNPEYFAKTTIKSMLTGYLVSFLLTVSIVLIGLGILGYSSLGQGPYVFARILFWIFLIPTTLLLFAAFSFYSMIKKNLQKTKPRTKRDTIIDIDPE